MPDWLTLTFEICGGVLAVAGTAGLLRRKVVQPLKRGYAELLQLLGQIRDASSGVQRLAREVESLAGAVSNFVVRIAERVDAHDTRLDRLEEMRELVIDVQADVQRLQRIHPHTGDSEEHP